MVAIERDMNEREEIALLCDIVSLWICRGYWAGVGDWRLITGGVVPPDEGGGNLVELNV